MKKTDKTILLLLFPIVAAAAAGIGLFAVSFPVWNAPLYFGSLALLALAFGAVCFLFGRLREAKRPLLRVGIGFFAFLAAAFAGVTLVNNVILHETKSQLAALIVSVLFAVCFLLSAVFLAAASGSAGWKKAAAALLCAAVIVYLGFDRALADENEVALTVNGRACAPAGKVEDLSRFTDGESAYCRWDATIYQYELTDAADLPNLLTLTFANSGKTLNVTYCEVDVTP